MSPNPRNAFKVENELPQVYRVTTASIVQIELNLTRSFRFSRHPERAAFRAREEPRHGTNNCLYVILSGATAQPKNLAVGA